MTHNEQLELDSSLSRYGIIPFLIDTIILFYIMYVLLGLIKCGKFGLGEKSNACVPEEIVPNHTEVYSLEELFRLPDDVDSDGNEVYCLEKLFYLPDNIDDVDVSVDDDNGDDDVGDDEEFYGGYKPNNYFCNCNSCKKLIATMNSSVNKELFSRTNLEKKRRDQYYLNYDSDDALWDDPESYPTYYSRQSRFRQMQLDTY